MTTCMMPAMQNAKSSKAISREAVPCSEARPSTIWPSRSGAAIRVNLLRETKTNTWAIRQGRERIALVIRGSSDNILPIPLEQVF
ncbi:hypothetical protein D9M68_898460 [compost metagenome]